MHRLRLSFFFLFLLTLACRTEPESTAEVDFYKTQLFEDIQLQAVFPDSKTLVDLVPKQPYGSLIALYEQQKDKPGFDLKTFVEEQFSDQSMATLSFATDTTKTMYEHISSIWSKLTRGPDSVIPHSSRLALPYAYVVPGGRFQEIYYWDSYFTMEGLLVDGEEKLATQMVDNFSYLIDTIGFIPNGTRNYFLSRSQPPFYTLMVDALARKDRSVLSKYHPQLLKEYEFWMAGEAEVQAPFNAKNHVVYLEGGHLNRYWDKENTPRQEAFKEDIHLASDLGTEAERANLYANLRAGAASGWDYSSRWFAVDGEFGSTTTTTIVPVDLNSLLYFTEITLAEAYGIQGDTENRDRFMKKAEVRKKAIQEYLWDADLQFFMDYDLKFKNTTDELTLAGAFPLFFKLASPEQAQAVKDRLMADFLKDGGLVTTLKHSGQQWDAPNGWAPLQWVAVKGLLNYGYEEEAKEIMQRWLALNEKVYENTGKMMEKYNVEDISLLSGGGEYETQDGFGWTNGVALGFKALLEQLEAQKD